MNCLRILKFLIRYLKEIKCRIYINISLQCSTIEHFSLCSKLVVFQGETVDQAPKKFADFPTHFLIRPSDFATGLQTSLLPSVGVQLQHRDSDTYLCISQN